jgi:PAS domain-containing protein
MGNILYATPFIHDIIGNHNSKYCNSVDRSELADVNPELEIKLKELIKIIHDAEQNNNKRKINFVIKHPLHIEVEGKNGIIYQVIIHSCLSEDKIINGFIINFHDVSLRKATEASLELEKVKYKLIAELTECALWEYDIETKELRQYRKLRGRYSNENLTIKNYRNVIIENGWIHPDDEIKFVEYCDSMDRGDAYLQYELRVMGDNHEYIWIRYQGACLKDSNGKAHMIVGRTLNIDKEHKEYEKLLQKSQRDH